MAAGLWRWALGVARRWRRRQSTLGGAGAGHGGRKRVILGQGWCSGGSPPAQCGNSSTARCPGCRPDGIGRADTADCWAFCPAVSWASSCWGGPTQWLPTVSPGRAVFYATDWAWFACDCWREKSESSRFVISPLGSLISADDPVM